MAFLNGAMVTKLCAGWLLWKCLLLHYSSDLLPLFRIKIMAMVMTTESRRSNMTNPPTTTSATVRTVGTLGLSVGATPPMEWSGGGFVETKPADKYLSINKLADQHLLHAVHMCSWPSSLENVHTCDPNSLSPTFCISFPPPSPFLHASFVPSLPRSPQSA